MPTIALPVKYRSPYGLPNALDPPTDSVPGFDPNFAQPQNLDSASAAPLPPDIPPPPRNAGAAMDTTGVKLPPLTPSSGIRKFKAPTMPPPEEVGSVDRQVATNTGPSPVTPAPAPAAPATQPAEQSATEKAAQNLEQVHAQRPQAPTSNWAQRLALAIMSATRLAPVANQIIHPKWAAEQAAYENTLADAEARQKEAVEAERGEAYSAQKEAQAESYKETNERRLATEKDRAQGVKDKIAAQTSERNRKFLQDRLKGREADAAYQGENDPRPPNYEFIPDPDKPGYGFAVPPAWRSAPKELLPFLPGVKENDQISHQEFKAATDALNKQTLAEHKPSKEPTNITEMQLAYQRETDPVKKKQLKDAIDAETSRQEKLHPQTTINLSPEAIEGIGAQYGQTGQLPALGFGKDAAQMRATILNNYFKGHAGANVAEAAAIFHADKNSLAALQKNRDAVITFENTAGKNLDLFLQQAKPIMDTGSPWINQPIRAIDRNGLGSADLAAYDAARRVAMTEVAKVVSNPGLSGQLSDAARKEVDSLNPESATLAQIYRVVGVLKQDMQNRHSSYDQMLTEIKGRLGGGSQPTHRYNPQTKKIEAVQ